MPWVRIGYKRLIRIEWFMTAAVFVLTLLGIMFIYSAGQKSSSSEIAGYYKKQALWCALGALGYVAFAIFDYRRLTRYAHGLFALSVLLLAWVLLAGSEVHGASRWLNVFGLTMQPSEPAKLSCIVMLAYLLARPERTLQNGTYILKIFVLLSIPFILIVKEPDLGTAVVLVPITFVMMYVAGVPLKTLAFGVMLGVLFLPLAWFGLSAYQQERISVFLGTSQDPYGAGWSRMQSLIAVGSGGLTGKGFLQGTQNLLGFVPRTVSLTDFIYSVIAEEIGFLGAVFVIALFMSVFMAGMKIVLCARDKFGALLTIGIMTMLFSHVFINMAMTIGVMPITGLPLPLVSYGGSFTIMTMAALGLVQSVYVRRIRV